MLPSAKLLRLSAAYLLLCGSVVLAHGHDGDEESVSVPTRPAVKTAESGAAMDTYFRLGTNNGWMIAHTLSMTLAWVFVLPVAVMLTVARSPKMFVLQTVFQLVNALGLVSGSIYNSCTPDLYPNNSHHKLGWALTWIYIVQNAIGVVNACAERRKAGGVERQYFIPVSTEALAEHGLLEGEERKHDQHRYSHDSGQGTERASSSLRSQSMSPTQEQDQPDSSRTATFADIDDDDETYQSEKRSRVTRIEAFVSRHVPAISNRVLSVTSLFQEIVNRLMLPMGFVAFTTGLVTYSGIFMEGDVFNGLAHCIKGGIFFWYGLLTLGRYVGSFADYGWAWNVKPSAELVGYKKARIPSAEFVESLVIFTYGASNVFLEHLAAWGQAWSPMDLEHVSISILFFGGGLCGMLVESTAMRNLLNSAVKSFKINAHDNRSEDLRQSMAYKTPSNPLPALVIMLLGLMMSSHHQSSMISSMVHKQWGMLLVGFSFARAVTYILLYISPPTSLYPSRPPSELITSFCLISGGLIFMASNRSTVTAMETFGLDAMFIFTVTMGFTAFLMAWTILVIAAKGWASR